MPFDRPTLSEIASRILNDFKNRVEGASTFLRRSVFKVMAIVYAGAAHLLYEYQQWMFNQFFVTTAETKYLEQLGSEYGIARNAGVKAVGAGTSTGTNGLIVPAGSEIQSSSGNIYTIDSASTVATGTVNLNFTAEAVGDDYNEPAGTSLTFVSPIAGISSTILVDSSGIINGSDKENDDDYRERILERKRQPPHGGAEFDYEVWAKEVSGVTRSWSIPLYNGIGTIGLAFVRDDDDDLIPSDAEVLEVYNYVISHTDAVTGKIVGIPVTAQPGFFMIPLEKLAVNFTIKITPNTSDVRASIESRLNDLMLEDGGPEQTIYLSRMYEAITSAVGEVASLIVSPAADVTASTNEVQILGDITFQDLT